MSDNIQPNNHYQMIDFLKLGDTPVANVERSGSVNTPAPAADVGWKIDLMNDNYAAASASATASASTADSGRPTNAAAITAVANNANNAIVNGIVSVTGKAFTALAIENKVAASEDGTITHKRKIPVLEDKGCSKSKKVKEEAFEYKKAK